MRHLADDDEVGFNPGQDAAPAPGKHSSDNLDLGGHLSSLGRGQAEVRNLDVGLGTLDSLGQQLPPNSHISLSGMEKRLALKHSFPDDAAPLPDD